MVHIDTTIDVLGSVIFVALFVFLTWNTQRNSKSSIVQLFQFVCIIVMIGCTAGMLTSCILGWIR